MGFLKSSRWINKIGKSVVAAKEYLKMPKNKNSNIIVVHDDLNQ